MPPYNGYYSGYPLRVAAGAGHLEVVELLLDHGADPNRCEPHLAPWGGALHAAAGKGHREVCEVLVAAGANLDQEVESSGNVVTMAGHWHHAELQTWLLEQGARWPFWHLIREGMKDELERRKPMIPMALGTSPLRRGRRRPVCPRCGSSFLRVRPCLEVLRTVLPRPPSDGRLYAARSRNLACELTGL